MTEVWWRRLPQRLLSEDDRLRQLQTDGLLTSYRWEPQSDGQLRLAAVVPVPEPGQELEVQFPARYPGECPSVLPRPYGTRLSTHQFGGSGVLCLELGPDNWHPRYGAADMLRSAAKLLAYEEVNRVVQLPIPSRHVETPGMQVRGKHIRAVVGAAARERLGAAPARGSFGYAVSTLVGPILLWLVQHPFGDALPDIPPVVAAREVKEGLFFRIAATAPSPPITTAELRSYLAAHAVEPPSADAALDLVLLEREGKEMEVRWVGGDSAFEVAVVAAGPTAEVDRLPTALAEVAKSTRVGIVGLGSVGSKVATSLARSGVRSFVLVDGDVFLPENVIRHDAGFLETAMLKVEAARERITSVASGPCEVETQPHAVADATNAAIHARTLDALTSVDLIVDATANPDAFNTLAWLASDAQRPLVWGELFAGGFGGLVGFAHPRLTPCPSCVRDAFLAHADAWPPAPRIDSGAPYVGSDGDRPAVATDADVMVIAGLVTATVLDTIQGSLGHRSAVTLLGLREGWIFDRPLDARSISVRRDDFSCTWCWTAPADPDPGLQETVERLLSTQTDAQNRPKL